MSPSSDLGPFFFIFMQSLLTKLTESYVGASRFAPPLSDKPNNVGQYEENLLQVGSCRSWGKGAHGSFSLLL